MKTLVTSIAVVVLASCSQAPLSKPANHDAPLTRAPASISCDDLFRDSTQDVTGLKKIFEAYKEASFNVVVKLIPSLRTEVAALQSRIYDQKKLCWAQERRSIDSEIMSLKSEIDRMYLRDETDKLKKSVESIK